jgi:hypothetical protein
LANGIEVIPANGSSYFISVREAQQVVARGDASWRGPKQIVRTADKSKRGVWEPAMSGKYGPLVMQLT